MKNFKLCRFLIFATFFFPVMSLNAGAQALTSRTFQVAEEAEVLVDLTASVPGASWVERGREAATITIHLDDRYQQDIILFNGAQRHVYSVMLGRQKPGSHFLRVDMNRSQSATAIDTAVLHDIRFTNVGRSQPEFQAIAHAPILYGRPNTIGQFSDIPLLVYVETLPGDLGTTYRYTAIFSNEDGGTQTAALMARWGRTTDIEWVIETTVDRDGNVLKSIFQGANHKVIVFQGKRDANHPILLTATDNNNFSDEGESKLRFVLRPILFDLARKSREEVMDRYPWIYRIMAEEMIREGKITPERKLGAMIGDLRQYLYIDAASDQTGGMGVSFAVKLKGNSQWFTSDLGVNSHKIERSGTFRTTVRLPSGISPKSIERIAVRCDVITSPRKEEDLERTSGGGCDLQSLNKAFFLDNNFQPASSLQFDFTPVKLQFGEMLELGIRADRPARLR